MSRLSDLGTRMAEAVIEDGSWRPPVNDWPEKLKQYTEEALATMADAPDREPYTFSAAISIMADAYGLNTLKTAILAQEVHKTILAETLRQMVMMIHELQRGVDRLEDTILALEAQLPDLPDDFDPVDAQRKGY